MVKKLVIIGAGDFGREIANVVERINASNDELVWEIIGFVDDNKDLAGQNVDGYRVLGPVSYFNALEEKTAAICSLGVSETRKKIINNILNEKIQWVTLIDPDARVYKGASVGEGSIICGGSIVAIGAKIGNHVVMNLNSTVGHDTEIGDYSVINPGVNISGKINCGECVDFGTGSRAIQGLTIANDVVIGAGGVVIRNIDESGTYIGVPVKRK